MLSDYNKILKQRNKLLSDFNIINDSEIELIVWNERIAEVGLKLWKSRKTLLDKYLSELEKYD